MRLAPGVYPEKVAERAGHAPILPTATTGALGSLVALAPFFYHPRMLAYDFGPGHPLKPERLRRAVAILEHYGFERTDPGEGRDDDVLRVHSAQYLDTVQRLSVSPEELGTEAWRAGLGPGDNPTFAGMYEASLAYVSGSATAARAVRDGDSLAISLSGGLHHAHKERASGFCIFNDPAVAIQILRERFGRVAYVDIDVHHGDGVQWMFLDDPNVLTCSIHEEPRTLFPGTGWTSEVGAARTSANVPLRAGTSGDTWIWAFANGLMPVLRGFEPEAIVLQMGTDAHFLDPLAHINCAAQDWLEAVVLVRDEGVPIVALGGGGYEITCVPRMWAAACLTLARVEFGDELPELVRGWGMSTFFDHLAPGPTGAGMDFAMSAVADLHANLSLNEAR